MRFGKKTFNTHLVRIYSTSASEKKYVINKKSQLMQYFPVPKIALCKDLVYVLGQSFVKIHKKYFLELSHSPTENSTTLVLGTVGHQGLRRSSLFWSKQPPSALGIAIHRLHYILYIHRQMMGHPPSLYPFLRPVGTYGDSGDLSPLMYLLFAHTLTSELTIMSSRNSYHM